MLRYVLPHLAALGGLMFVCYSPGLIADGLFPAREEPAYPHLTRFTLGFLFWFTFLFAASVLGALRQTVVWIAIAAILLGGAVASSRRAASRLAIEPRWRAGDPATWPPILALIVVLAAMFVLALRPTLGWDADTYHLTVPRLYIENHGFRQIPYNVYSNWPLGLELLFALAMMVYDYVLATLVHPVFAVLTTVAIVRFTRVHRARWAGPAAACLFMANDVVLFESGIAYVNVAFAFFFMMAICFRLEAERVPQDRTRNLVLAGICGGMMAAVKLIGLFGIAGLVVELAWDGWRRARLPAAIREIVLLVGIPSALIAFPWYLKSMWYTGNPVYPMAYGLLGGVEWNEELGRQWQQFMSLVGASHTVRDYLLLPIRVILEGGPRYEQFGGQVGAFWIALLPLLVVMSWKDRAVRACTLPSLVYFACWAASSQQTRYLIPILPLLSAATAVAVAQLPFVRRETAPAHRLRFAMGIAASAAVVIAAEPYLADSRTWLSQYRDHPRAMKHAGVLPVYDYINERLPADARLMFLNTNHGFFCKREFVADSFFEASQLNALLLAPAHSEDELARTLSAQHITHVLVGHDHWNIPYPDSLGQLLNDRAAAKLLYQSPQGDRLYELQPRTPL